MPDFSIGHLGHLEGYGGWLRSFYGDVAWQPWWLLFCDRPHLLVKMHKKPHSDCLHINQIHEHKSSQHHHMLLKKKLSYGVYGMWLSPMGNLGNPGSCQWRYLSHFNICHGYACYWYQHGLACPTCVAFAGWAAMRQDRLSKVWPTLDGRQANFVVWILSQLMSSKFVVKILTDGDLHLQCLRA